MQQAMQRFTALILLLAASTLGLIGCGNKGPLYLPPEVVQEVTSTASNSAESEEPSQAAEPQGAEKPEAIKTGTIEPKTIETGTIEAE